MSSAVQYPSATSRKASSRSAPCSRFMTKPSISRCMTIGDWPRSRITASARTMASGEVHGAGTSSIAGIK